MFIALLYIVHTLTILSDTACKNSDKIKIIVMLLETANINVQFVINMAYPCYATYCQIYVIEKLISLNCAK